jgi:spore germination protein YaaH
VWTLVLVAGMTKETIRALTQGLKSLQKDNELLEPQYRTLLASMIKDMETTLESRVQKTTTPSKPTSTEKKGEDKEGGKSLFGDVFSNFFSKKTETKSAPQTPSKN